MKIIHSKLENNVFNGILIKKGKNLVTDLEFALLTSNIQYLKQVENKNITFIQKDNKSYKINNKKPDFSAMSYDELKKYVKENNIKTASYKKADILDALKNL